MGHPCSPIPAGTKSKPIWSHFTEIAEKSKCWQSSTQGIDHYIPAIRLHSTSPEVLLSHTLSGQRCPSGTRGIGLNVFHCNVIADGCMCASKVYEAYEANHCWPKFSCCSDLLISSRCCYCVNLIFFFVCLCE